MIPAHWATAGRLILEQQRAFAARVVEAAVPDVMDDVVRVGADGAGQREEVGRLEPVDRHGPGLDERLERRLELRSFHFGIQGLLIGGRAHDPQDPERELDIQRSPWSRQVEVPDDWRPGRDRQEVGGVVEVLPGDRSELGHIRER